MEDGIAVAYLLRGKDTNWQDCCNRFLYSYQQYAAGCDHELHIIIKGFECPEDELRARQIIAPLECHVSSVADDAFDIGAYREWSKGIKNTVICLMNTGSEILADHWLQKLHGNFLDPSVGMVGATGSFESLGSRLKGFPAYPNPHIRTNAFLLAREQYLEASEGRSFKTKEDAFRFESGNTSLTQFVKRAGLEARVVGRNGRAYREKTWPVSNTFRQGRQHNLLVGDRQTRGYALSPWHRKKYLASAAWGSTLRNSSLYRWG